MIPNKKPTLKDKIIALQSEKQAVDAELGAVKGAIKRVVKSIRGKKEN